MTDFAFFFSYFASYNLGGDKATLKVQGEPYINVFHATLRDGDTATPSPAERRFCRLCGTALWLWDSRWPELVHPLASAIDTPLPTPPEVVQIMRENAPAWALATSLGGDVARIAQHHAYPAESLADWHTRHRLSQA
ncbi:MAG: GFA family protein [Hymenobacter sp.]|nr:MAG: GFA family protein [Hymenobacter sp.]